MKKYFLLLPLLTVGSILLAQGNANFIEVAVHEPVELKVSEVTCLVSIHTVEMQMEMLYQPQFEEYEEYDEPYPDSYEYFGGEYDNLSAKEKKKVEAAYNQALVDWDAAYEARMAEGELALQERLSNFSAFSVQQAIEMLQSKGIAYTLRIDKVLDPAWEGTMYADTQLVVKAASREAYDQLSDLFFAKAATLTVEDMIFESIDTKSESVLPVLTTRAKAQAEILAGSISRKLGPVMQISNVHPGFSTALLEVQMESTRDLYREFRDMENPANPFGQTKKSVVEFIFRFGMLN